MYAIVCGVMSRSVRPGLMKSFAGRAKKKRTKLRIWIIPPNDPPKNPSFLTLARIQTELVHDKLNSQLGRENVFIVSPVAQPH
jgi:hypothetical protein